MLEVQTQELAHGQEPEWNQGTAALLEVIDRCLDKGIVVEGWVSVRVLGFEVLTLDFNSFVASFDKYLEYAVAATQAEHIAQMDDVEREQVPLP